MNRRKNPRGNASMRPKDWLILGAGLVVVAGLVAFVLMRTNRGAGQVPTAIVAPAPAATTSNDHDHAAEASVRRITAAELRAALDRGDTVVIDVRDMDSYAAGHIPGSMHIPLSFIESQMQYLPRGKTIVAYCT